MSFNIPVVFIIYNRVNTTKKVFNQIRKIKPTHLFIIADGPKNPQDAISVNETRKIIENVDWNCELHLDFSEYNLGCSDRIITGINNVFKKIDRAIFLEDDCFPHLSFFDYCRNLLEFHENNNSIMHISGFNLMGAVEIENSYFYSRYILPPWGWATWKRSWEKFNPKLDTWQQIKLSAHTNISQEYFSDWTDLFEGARVNRETWDISWNVDLWKHNGIAILPKRSLIQNIGFGCDATFTKNKDIDLSKIKGSRTELPLSHPTNIHLSFDKEIENKIIRAVRQQIKKIK